MSALRVALVTGASRGVGAGIAKGLGELGYKVFVTGRSDKVSQGVAFDGSSLSGTVVETSQAVTKAGGEGVAIACDHADDSQVAALFARIRSEAGRLDMLINNASYMHAQLFQPKPFWEKGLDAQKILDVGLRSAYVASWHAAQIMVAQGSGLIGFTSSPGGSCYMHGPAYGAQKAGVDKLAHDMEHDLRGTGVVAVSLWLGLQKTERAARVAVLSDQFQQLWDSAENPEFSAHIFDAIARSDNCDELSGGTYYGAEIAKELGILDRGEERQSFREKLGAPHPKNPAAVY
ncbi:SDR family NAD(P)-dependent oxidoreductase [Erythrobacter aurantius]|uniref:SDR family NAD(P)-dependent oxidoreductase n=1 Tax=Erythrobacter aurantius TaxID=2909249 RepID=UPI00207AD45F|nr:SDR family NAD(P)-dependent oxidoreductase [Erythrobacter aurantius]